MAHWRAITACAELIALTYSRNRRSKKTKNSQCPHQVATYTTHASMWTIFYANSLLLRNYIQMFVFLIHFLRTSIDLFKTASPSVFSMYCDDKFPA